MKGKSAKLKLQRRIADYSQMVGKGKDSYRGYSCPGSNKRT